jgi:hypothetical protein
LNEATSAVDPRRSFLSSAAKSAARLVRLRTGLATTGLRRAGKLWATSASPRHDGGRSKVDRAQTAPLRWRCRERELSIGPFTRLGSVQEITRVGALAAHLPRQLRLGMPAAARGGFVRGVQLAMISRCATLALRSNPHRRARGSTDRLDKWRWSAVLEGRAGYARASAR